MRFIDGIGGRVTGSCIHFCHTKTNTQFLVDCGWQFERTDDIPDLHLSLTPGDIKFVVLTHAHLDHSGLIPKLYEYGFSGKIYCTSATAEIAKCLLKDSANHGNFGKEYVDNIKFVKIDERETGGFIRPIPVSNWIFISFIRSSHMLGAASVHIWWDHVSPKENPDKQIVISGDIGRNTKDNNIFPLLSYAQLPYGYPRYIIVESTYGSACREEEHNDFEKRIERLSSIIGKADQDDKFLIIPAFALQRAQDILFDLYYIVKNISFSKKVRIILNSRLSLSSKIIGIYGKELCRKKHHKKNETFYRNKSLKDILEIYSEEELDEFLYKLFPIINEEKKGEEKKDFRFEVENIDIASSLFEDTINKLADKSYTNIVLTTSGMLHQGPSKGFLKRYLENDSAIFLLTGYIGNNSISDFIRGIINYENRNRSDRIEYYSEVEIDGKIITANDVKSIIEDMRPYYSGHADQNELIRFIFEVKKEEKIAQSESVVFINHGQNSAREGLKRAIESYNNRENKTDTERNVSEIHLPDDSLKWFDCDENKWIEPSHADVLLEKILNSQERARYAQEKWFKKIFEGKSNQAKKRIESKK